MFESLGKAIRKLIDRKIRNTAVAIPGIVVSYDAVKKTAKVQPAIYRAVPNASDEDTDSFEEIPPIPGVPVAWPKARGFILEGSLNPGDPVLLVACDRDISGWRRSGRLSEPRDGREHHWANAVALPGLVPSTNPFPTPSDAAALNSKVLANLNELRDKLNDLTTKYLVHVHLSAAPSSPTSAPGPAPTAVYVPPAGLGPSVPVSAPTTASAMTSTASTILKLEN